MTRFAFVLAALLSANAAFAAPKPAKECGGPRQLACGRITQEDIDEVFAVVLQMSGYDSNPNDQASYGKPARRTPTKLVRDARLLKALGAAGALAAAANTGFNTGPRDNNLRSLVVIDSVAMRDFCQSRGQVAFILAHELTHLMRHDPEETEKNNKALFEAWYPANLSRYPEGTKEIAILKDWEKATERARAAFQKPREELADTDATQWIRTLKDPAANRPFEKDAGENALAAAREWLKALGEDDSDPFHGSVRERIAALRKKRPLMEPGQPAKAR